MWVQPGAIAAVASLLRNDNRQVKACRHLVIRYRIDSKPKAKKRRNLQERLRRFFI